MIIFMIVHILFHWLSLFSWKQADWSYSNTSAKHCPPRSTSSSRRCRWLGSNGALVKGGSRQHGQIVKSTTCGWDKPGPGMSKTRSEQTWYAKTTEPVMDVDIHSDKEHGVTSLEHRIHHMTKVLL